MKLGNYFVFFICVLVVAFFNPFFIKGLLPIPSDTIVGLYYPYRDFYIKEFPRGVPFKNFLITDPVRQIYPWKNLAIDSFSKGQLPLWNPYEMGGKPLLANFQTGALYPLNILFFIKPFHLSWTLFILLQLILGGIFMYLYLSNLKIDHKASAFGAIAFIFSGFSVAWLEWGNVLHTGIWLPLILLSVDKIFGRFEKKWVLILAFSLVSSFLSGHLQIFFYVFALFLAYVIFKFIQSGNRKAIVSVFLVILFFVLATLIQWFSTLRFILLSSRAYDLNWKVEGWFIPLKHLVQFIVPDFFGNPATMNYFGAWNYAELIGYIGIAGIIFAAYSLFFVKRNILFFAIVVVMSLVFSIDSPLSSLPFRLNLPFIATAQPTRLLFVICFSLSVLSAYGFNEFIEKPSKKVFLVLGLIMFLLSLLWLFNLSNTLSFDQVNILVSRRNLVFPTLLTITLFVVILVIMFLKKYKKYLMFLILFVLVFDLFRFAYKFEPFERKEYLYPKTKIIDFLQSKSKNGLFRIASTDRRIFPPNFSVIYKLESIEGYDPLYLLSYAKYIAALERNSSDIDPPYGYNRIITPHNVSSKLLDLLNVKYVLSLSEIKQSKFKEVFREGQTIVYENLNVIDRAFFVEEVKKVEDEKQMMSEMLSSDLSKLAFSQNSPGGNFKKGKVRILETKENSMTIETQNVGKGFLVLTDVYYPNWIAKIDGKEVDVYRIDLTFRGVIVPEGKHLIVFDMKLF